MRCAALAPRFISSHLRLEQALMDDAELKR